MSRSRTRRERRRYRRRRTPRHRQRAGGRHEWTTRKTTTQQSSSARESNAGPPQQHSNHNQQTSKTAISVPATHSIVSKPHFLFQHRYRPTSSQTPRALSRFLFFFLLLFLSFILTDTRRCSVQTDHSGDVGGGRRLLIGITFCIGTRMG